MSAEGDGVVNVNPPELAPPVGFSHATRAGRLVALAGQIGCDAEGRVRDPGDIAAQFRVAIGNVRLALEAAGCRPVDVIKLSYFVTDVAAYRVALKPIGQAYREVFGDHYPASTLVGVAALFDPHAMVEIDCLAVADEVER